MKTLMLILTALMILTGQLVAAELTKDEACGNYFKSVQYNQSENLRLRKSIIALNVAAELNYDSEQMMKLQNYFESIIKINPNKIHDIGKTLYFVCTTDLTTEDKAIIKEEINSVVME